MNFAALFKALDTAFVLRDTVRRLKSGSQPPPETAVAPTAVTSVANQIEARLTNVVVAALKEAFDRDHARLELERAQLEEQRRRADEALRAEERRQAVERELARLRLVAGTALLGWIASVGLFIAARDAASVASRGLMAAGWLLLLGSLGASLAAQRRTGEPRDAAAGAARTGDIPVWLLLGGLGLAAISLLF